MTYLMRLVLGQLSESDRARTEGMLQIRTFIPLDASTAVDHARMEIWRNMKKGLVEKGYAGDPMVALVDFCMKGTDQTLTFGLAITDDAIERVKAGVGFSMESALMPVKTDVPLSRQACLDFINMHIRSDKRNQLRLRTEMTKEGIAKLTNHDEEE